MDEVFGANNFVTTIIWEKRTTRENRRVFSFSHDYVVCYARNLSLFEKVRGTLPLTAEVKGRYANPDNDPRGTWQSVSMNAQGGHGTASQFYRLTTPGGRELDPPPGRCWSVTETKFKDLVADKRIYFGAQGTNAPRVKKFLSETTKGLTPHTLWNGREVGTTDSATKTLFTVFAGDPSFNTTPKPTELIERILQIATIPGELVLDSFAGSGTTGHAVLRMNAANPEQEARRFILVELESSVARNITAERVRRVSEGYTNAKGEKVAGLGGGFRFCELGEPLFDESGHIRETVKFGELARHVYFSETREPLPRERVPNTPLLGVCRGVAVYLLFNGILGDKSSNGGNVLTRKTLAWLPPFAGPKVIYCAGCLIGAERLVEEGITVRQTPYEIRVS